MFHQLSLFEPNINDLSRCFHRNIKNSGFDYQEIDIGDITFKAGQLESVHRWYRLTPSYSPSLVRFWLKELLITKEHFVVDPFSGRGTTSIECQKQGIKTLGIEINPLLQQVGSKSLRWNISNLHLFEKYLIEVSSLIQEFKSFSLEDVLRVFNTNIPIIHNVFRWWKKYVLKDLIVFREVMLNPDYFPVKDYLWIAVNEACLDCANIHRNHPTITFDDNHQRNIDVLSEVSKNLGIIQADLISLNSKEISFSELGKIIIGNSTHNLQKQINSPVDFVITSPPYPNRYSYVHQTRPQLYFMEILDNIREATKIDLQAVGGTWGKATSVLQNELILVPSEIKPYLCYYEELQQKSVLMCNYATKYFIDMWQHIKFIKMVKATKFRGVYIVGNSRLSGVEIFTESILGKLFVHEGFEVERIVSFRKRGGKQRLYETAVCVRS
ncbi:cytosine-N4-specific DNA methylase [Oscillatoriales cyanobacterium USR001]|nr:cytosine-N4-specific DNA methylase [Oscillatoriales cyanobacterium USR001]